jgi:hypothetical protein
MLLGIKGILADEARFGRFDNLWVNTGANAVDAPVGKNFDDCAAATRELHFPAQVPGRFHLANVLDGAQAV